MKLFLAATLYVASAIALPSHYSPQTQMIKAGDGSAPMSPATNILVKIGLIGDHIADYCVGLFEFCSPMNNLPCCDNLICTYCPGDAGGRTICHNNRCTGSG